jgi:adenine-specific DNA-methyltransferase
VPTGNVRQGFVYRRSAYITSGSIANNAEIDVIWEQWHQTLEPLRRELNAALKQQWEEWEIPREADAKWSDAAKHVHADWWTAGPFTVESLSPHRVLGVDENDELIDPLAVAEKGYAYGPARSFEQMILENLKTAGVQQAHKEDRITFTSVVPWPGELICAEGRYREGEKEKRAGILIGPEFGTVTRPDLVAAAREAGDAGFDVVIACAFNYEAPATEFSKLGRIPVLTARMNADLHMAGELRDTDKANLFVIFGEPDIDILTEKDGLGDEVMKVFKV